MRTSSLFRTDLSWSAIVWTFSLLALPPAKAQLPGPSLVSVSGRQLIVRKRNLDGTLASAAPYTIRGVVWSPASKNTDTTPTDPNNAAIRRPEFAQWAATDIPLMAGMNANTARVFLDLGFGAVDGPAGLQILDQLYARGIMVIMTVDDATNKTARITAAVNFYKNHPAILLWMLGNEWNINRYYGAASSVLDAAQRTESAAALIKSLDSNHPVSTSYGEIDINAAGLRLADTQHYVRDIAPSVDIWGLNIYRSSSFGTLFAQWASISTKPMFLGEFGTDTLYSSCARSNPPDTVLDERTQKLWDLGLWNEIAANLSSSDPAKVALGGTVFELSDEWWKVTPSGSQQKEGFLFVNGHPDDFANEEYFGLADIDRNPRGAYHAFRLAFAPGATALPLPPSRVDFFSMPATITTNLPAFPVTGSVQIGSRAFVNGTEIAVDSGGTFATRFPLSAAQNLAVGPNAISLRVLGPDGSETTTAKTADYQPGFSTQETRLLYVDSVAPELPGTIVIDLDRGVLLGLIDQQHVRGISADGTTVYMDSRARISTASHTNLPGGPLPFTSALPINGFLVGPLGDFLYSGNEIVDRPSNTLLASHLPVSIVTGNSFSGAPIPGGPAITPDGRFLFTGFSNSLIRIDRSTLTSTAIPTPSDGSFVSDFTVSPDGTTLGRVTYGASPIHSVFYDTSGVNRIGAADFPGDYSGEMVFSPGGQCAVVGNAGNPVDRAGGVTSIDFPALQPHACSLIDLAANLTISSGNELYVSSGTRYGVDVLSLQPCVLQRRTRTYFLGINQFVSGQGVFASEIRRIVLRDLPALTVEVGGTGRGTVTSNSAGIDCGIDCMEGYASGTVVTLTATAASGSTFTGWNGSGCSGTGSCVVTVDAAKAVTATFTLAGPPGLDFFSVTPCRILDTRTSGPALASGVKRIVQVTGLCAIPSNAVAVSINVTAVAPSSNGSITLFPGNSTLPPTSSINFSPGMVRTNNVILSLATDVSGTIAAQAFLAGGGQVDLIIDINGFFR